MQKEKQTDQKHTKSLMEAGSLQKYSYEHPQPDLSEIELGLT